MCSQFVVSGLNATTNTMQQQRDVSPTFPWAHYDPYLLVVVTCVTFVLSCFCCDLVYTQCIPASSSRTKNCVIWIQWKRWNQAFRTSETGYNTIVQYPMLGFCGSTWVISGLTSGSVKQFVIYPSLQAYLHTSSRWRHNEHDGVSNCQPHGCSLNRLYKCRSKKISKLRVTGLCAGTSPGPMNSPHKGPVTRKMFPFDDVIICMC